MTLQCEKKFELVHKLIIDCHTSCLVQSNHFQKALLSNRVRVGLISKSAHQMTDIDYDSELSLLAKTLIGSCTILK